jgi:hypothetical protein
LPAQFDKKLSPRRPRRVRATLKPLAIGVQPRLAAVIEPHVVVTEGAPGSVEKGEREQRGSRLLLTTPARTASRIEMSLPVLK